MARDLTVEEFTTIREQLRTARGSANQVAQISSILSVLDTFVSLFAESADSTLVARSRFDEVAGNGESRAINP